MSPADVQGAHFSIIADDLTGACDSAVAFAQRGLRVEVLLDNQAIPPSEGVWSISTESRDIAEDAAIRRVCDSREQACKAREIFKKIDSVFRGNTFAEIRAAVDCFPCELAVLAPAYPSMGRMVRDGVLRIRDAGENRSVDLLEGLRRVGLGDVDVVKAKDFADRAQRAGKTEKDLLLADAESMEELQAVVGVVRSLSQRILWIGSGGLAYALAAEMPQIEMRRRGEPANGSVVLFVGSDHAVTQKQVEAMKGKISVLERAVEEFTGVSNVAECVILKVRRGVTTEDQIRRAAAHLALRGMSCCLMTGGDTAMLVCRALGVSSLLLTEEFAPGLPQGIAMGGALDQVPVILKSGGFGQEDVLCQLAHRWMKRKEFA